METIDVIRDAIPEDELLAQLAEEAAELAHAALKLRRSINGKNPTPVTPTQAEENLIEELADVKLCAEILDRWTRIADQIDGIAESKLGRWAKRLEEQRDSISNADRIRNMSDEELVDVLVNLDSGFTCWECTLGGVMKCPGDCVGRCLEWLRRSAEGVQNDQTHGETV